MVVTVATLAKTALATASAGVPGAGVPAVRPVRVRVRVHARRPRVEPWPAIPSGPAIPDLSAGLCSAGEDVTGLPAGAWDDATTPDGQVARDACGWCPCLAACRAYALTDMPLSHFTGIIAGMSREQIVAVRRENERSQGA